MKTFLWIMAGVTVFVVVYAVWLRPLMRVTPWGKAWLDKVEPLERALWKKSETILVGRTLTVLGGFLTLATQLGTIDITPLMPLVPEQHRVKVTLIWNMLPIVVSVLGWLIEQLRYDVTKPVEIVAMRTDAPAEVKALAADAAVANAVAAEAVKISGAA